jgi:hypothetical protein
MDLPSGGADKLSLALPITSACNLVFRACRLRVKDCHCATLAARPVYPRYLTIYRVAQLGSLGPVRDVRGTFRRLEIGVP